MAAVQRKSTTVDRIAITNQSVDGEKNPCTTQYLTRLAQLARQYGS